MKTIAYSALYIRVVHFNRGKILSSKLFPSNTKKKSIKQTIIWPKMWNVLDNSLNNRVIVDISNWIVSRSIYANFR